MGYGGNPLPIFDEINPNFQEESEEINNFELNNEEALSDYDIDDS